MNSYISLNEKLFLVVVDACTGFVKKSFDIFAFLFIILTIVAKQIDMHMYICVLRSPSMTMTDYLNVKSTYLDSVCFFGGCWDERCHVLSKFNLHQTIIYNECMLLFVCFIHCSGLKTGGLLSILKNHKYLNIFIL